MVVPDVRHQVPVDGAAAGVVVAELVGRVRALGADAPVAASVTSLSAAPVLRRETPVGDALTWSVWVLDEVGFWRQVGTVSRTSWTRSRHMYRARDVAGVAVAGDGGGLIGRRGRAVAALVELDGRRRAAGVGVVERIELDGLGEGGRDMGGQRPVRVGFKVGDEVTIRARAHPHVGESGRIVEAATGNAATLGFDWRVDLDAAYAGGAFVRESDIVAKRAGPGSRGPRGRSR